MLIPTHLECAGIALEPALEQASDIQLRVCGMGPMAAALSAARWLAELRPSSCILAGLAGTRDVVRAPIASLVVGTAIRNEAVGSGHGAAFRSLLEMAPDGEDVAPDPLPLDAPPRWMEVAPKLASQGARRIQVVAGQIGTVATASASVEEADGWLSRTPEVLIEEMEGYAVALACLEARVPLSIVRGVSNRAGIRDKRQWDAPGALTALREFLAPALGVHP